MLLKITYEETTYRLGFSRNTIRRMEKAGFDFTKAESSPVSTTEDLFTGAFLLHHQNIKPEKIREIYKHIPNKQELFMRLAEMYQESISTLMSEPEEDDAKKAMWEVE